MQRAGLGALFEAFEKLKNKLALEGLFDASNKKPIPKHPKQVGIVTATAGPATARQSAPPEAVWITAESLGDRDPAAAAHPELPVEFVFDAPLLRRLRLSVNRLIFLAESVADLATRREVQLWRGDPVEVLQGRQLAATFAPVPGWKSRAARLDVVSLHPWPWLRRPRECSVSSYSAWNKGR